MKLSGDARVYIESVETLRNASTFDTLAAGLAERCSDKRGISYYRDQLSTLRQKQGEGFEAFADRIRSVSCRTYTLGTDAVRNEILLEEAELRAIDVFIRGINPKYGGKIKVASPRSLHEAVRLAILREEADRFVSVPTRANKSRNIIVAAVAAVAKQVTRQSTAAPRFVHVVVELGIWAGIARQTASGITRGITATAGNKRETVGG